ncbi:FAD-dependent oxidoreductase [Lipingzhangella sp. LS1_29]|uniref:FAD-dependent oxidoreductase n=1 Tax=Lipingzhangella rawalii TaxID=2055835 RepID=A0ABU2H4S8_9ACTN|nr:FAD-dependent oxidoreductase [Lipingzhangella rawalii]MDS1270312.1 FAD-dependent oxidoreductase [Lipingzhangella rawalii]
MQDTNSATEQVTTVVVGAGLSGLSAARRLLSSGIGSFLVVEGDVQVGGRALPLRGSPAGQPPGHMLVWADDSDVLHLADELDVAHSRFDPTDNGVDLRLDREGHVSTTDHNLPLATSWWTRLRSEYLYARLARLARDADPDSPWRSPDAGELDAHTVRGWLRHHSRDPELLRLLEESLTIEASMPADQISMLWLIAHLGPEPEIDPSYVRIDQAELCQRMAASLPAERVRTSWHVARITRTADGVEVSGPRGTVRCERVIIATAPSDAGQIDYRPRLPHSRGRLHRQWPAAELIRSELTYWRPFWRNFGWSGTVYCEDGLPALALDDSPDSGAFGRLVAFTHTFGEGDPMGVDLDVLDNPAQHEGLLLDNLRRVFGPLAAEPREIAHSRDYPGPYSRAYQAPTPPGLLTDLGPLLRRPVDRMHWAGTETGPYPENGTLDGAIASGIRAADEVTAQLDRN